MEGKEKKKISYESLSYRQLHYYNNVSDYMWKYINRTRSLISSTKYIIARD